MAKIKFDTTSVPEDPNPRPKTGFGLIPKGRYPAEIINTKVIQMQSVKGGEMVELDIRITEGEYENRRVWQRITTKHPGSAQAEGIGQRLMANVCEAVGIVGELTDTADLHHRPFLAGIGVKDRRDPRPGQDPQENVLSYAKAIEGAAPVRTPTQPQAKPVAGPSTAAKKSW